MRWPAFKYADKVYDLTHLHPTLLRFESPGGTSELARRYDVLVIFGLHCFTRGRRPGEIVEPALIYPNSYESRVFDEKRYEHSSRLVEMIRGLPLGKPRHNGNRGNFLPSI